MKSDEIPRLMTATEAAEHLNMCSHTFRREVRAGRIRFVMIGKRKKYLAEDLISYVHQQREKSQPRPPSERPRLVTSSHSSSTGTGMVAARRLQIEAAQKKSRK